jgi:hypothetical protein
MIMITTICVIDSVIAYAFQQVVKHAIIHVGLGEIIVRRFFTITGIGRIRSGWRNAENCFV